MSVNADRTAPTPPGRVLTWCLHLLFLTLLAVAAARAVLDAEPGAAAIVAVAAVCALVYAAGPFLVRTRRTAAVWLGVLGVTWSALVVLTADGVWVAFPLFFLELHLLSRRVGLGAVIATTLVAITAFSVHQGVFRPVAALGPTLGAAVAVAVVWGYQALYRESEQRRRLIEELTATRADLARAQHAAGVAAERERLAHEIHDTLAQGLSSIQLLLRAAERSLPESTDNAARYVDQARQAAADNLAEARRFVAALAPPALDDTTLADALRRLCVTTDARHRTAVDFQVLGEPEPLPTAHEVALLRVGQAGLANVVRHAEATSVSVTLRYLDDHVTLEIADDGMGFDPGRVADPDPGEGGFGLPSLRARTRTLGGCLTVDSSPGRGTVLTARLPRSAGTPGERS